jgi:hypothetical protein
MAREQLASHNAIATFSDMESARAALLALENGGIDGNDLSILGRGAAEAATETDPRERDAGALSTVAKAGAAGTAAGATGGALVGLIGGALAWGIPGIGPVVGSALWAATLGGAGVGAAIGGLVTGTAVIGQSEGWADSYHESIRAGQVLVGVHVDGRRQLDKAVGILESKAPLRIDRLDEKGRPLP